MIPSHANLHVAPFANPEYANDRISYWDSVYGFDMSAMSEDIERNADVSSLVPADKICGTSSTFKELDMYDVRIADLSFKDAKYSSKLAESVMDSPVDGLALWFDVCFCSQPRADRGKGEIMLSTAPNKEPTHWGQAILLFNRKFDKIEDQTIGSLLSGKIGYAKGREAGSLEITATWESSNEKGKGRQVWCLI